MGSTFSTDPTIVASVGTLQEADVLRTALRARGFRAQLHGERMSQWFPHWGVAVNPTGIHVVVPPEEAKDAAAFLEERRSAAEEAAKEEPEGRPADYYAVGACWSALFSLLVLPAILVTFYCFFKALAVAGRRRPERPRRFRRLMTLAFLLGVLPYAILIALLGGVMLVGLWNTARTAFH
ncbi:MAG TPA: hypothetical protein VFJ30_14740 [Phycisphaerae bacterium]|nr:hypothetical protein [Phycisphaerae bacterium]